MDKSTLPDCPECGSNNSVFPDFTVGGRENFWCNFCKVSFDDDPDEGGDWSTDPTRRIQWQEASAKTQEKNRKAARAWRRRRR